MSEAPSKPMREGDWLCAECQAHNFNARITCYQCTLPKTKSELMSKGRSAMDWDCFGCKTSNFSWRRECFRCRISKEESDEMREVEVGVEWHCRFCNLVNFPNRSDCFKCKRGRGVCDGGRRQRGPSPPRRGRSPPGRYGGGPPRGRPSPPRQQGRGRSPPMLITRPRSPLRRAPSPRRQAPTPSDNSEWGCSLCGTFNGFRRQDCYKCATPRRAPGPDHRDGWDCVECLSDNYSSRKECYKCRAPRPGGRPLLSTPGDEYYEPELETPRGGGGGPPVDKVRQQYGPDWVCKFCDVDVFPTRGDCYKCGRLREECESMRVTVPMLSAPPAQEGFTCGCGTFNRAGEEPCDWCGKPNPARLSRPGPPEAPHRAPLNSGEWDCRECRINNYPDRKACFICKRPRSEVEEVAVQRGGGGGGVSWGGGGGRVRDRSPLPPRRPLLDHHDQGYSTRRFSPPSFRGGMRSPPRRRGRSPPYRRERSPRQRGGPINNKSGDYNYTPDWECRECKINNFTKRKKCFRCGKPKEEVEVITNEHGKPLKPDDWLCPVCNGHNFSRRTDCYKCHAVKPALGSSEDQVMDSETGNEVESGE